MKSKDIILLEQAYERMSSSLRKSSRNWEAEYNDLVDAHGPADWNSADLAGVDRRDYPDFSDAYIEAIDFTDGTPVPDDYLDVVRDVDSDEFHDAVMKIA